MTHSIQIVCLALNPFIGINYAGKKYLLLGCQQNTLCLGISENARIRFSTKTQRYASSHSTRKSLGWTSECLLLVHTTFPHGLSLGICKLLWSNSSYLHQSIWTSGICRADTQVSVCGSEAYCKDEVITVMKVKDASTVEQEIWARCRSCADSGYSASMDTKQEEEERRAKNCFINSFCS